MKHILLTLLVAALLALLVLIRLDTYQDNHTKGIKHV